MAMPVGLLDEMNDIIKDENRQQRRQQAKSRANRGRR